MPIFLADGEGVTSCANNLVGKHFEKISGCTLDPINKKSVLPGLSLNFLVTSKKTRPEDIWSEFLTKHRDFSVKEITISGYRRRKDDV